MALIDLSSIARTLEPGVRKFVGVAYNNHDKQFEQIVDVIKSNKYAEHDVMEYGLGLAPVKDRGSSIHYDEMALGATKNYIPVTYGLGYSITREAVEDNLYQNQVKNRSIALAKSMRETKEILVANLLNNAFDSAYAGVDGKELCATNHVLSKGGALRNELSSAADLSEASLEQCLIDINDFTDEAGLKCKMNAEKLIVPKELVFDACRILKSALQNDTTNNAVNAIKYQGMLSKGHVVNQYLDDVNAFFIKTDAMQGLQLFQRRALETSSDTPDFDTENMKFKATERYSTGWTDFRCIFGSPGSS